jgi:gas vesicle protein
MSKENNSPSFISGLLWGGLIGGSMGVILATEKGEKIRDKIKVLLEKHQPDYAGMLNEIKGVSSELLASFKSALINNPDILEKLHQKKKPAKKPRPALRKKTVKRRKK